MHKHAALDWSAIDTVMRSHPTTLAIKNLKAQLSAHFDACYSTHTFQAPKEDAAFWPRLRAEPAGAGYRRLSGRRTSRRPHV